MKKLVFTFLLILLSYPVYGQTSITGTIMEAPAALRPITCAPGDMFFATDTFVLYQCGPTNTWVANTSSSAFGYASATATGALTLNSNTNFFYDYTLTGNVTSMTVTSVGQVPGTIYGVKFCQPNSGGTYNYTVAWPTVFNNPPLVFVGQSQCTSMAFKLNNSGSWDPIVRVGYYQQIMTAGIAVPQQQNLNFLSPFTVTNNVGLGTTDIGLPLFYQTIQSNAVPIVQRPVWNAVPPFTCVDNGANTRSDCSIPVAVGVGASHASGLVPDPGASGATTDYLGRDMAYHTAAAGSNVKPDPVTALQYVAGTCFGGVPCVDANDGLSWGTAKLTVSAALQALPHSGGVVGQIGSGNVYIGPGAVSNAAGPQYGIWIMGPSDPNFNSPPTGWLKCVDVLNQHLSCIINLIGTTGPGGSPNGHMNRVVMLGGSNADNNHPGLWFNSLGVGITVQNLQFGAGRGGVLGECSDNSRTSPCGVVSETFINDGFGVFQAPNNGPGLDLTGYSFWLWFRDCGFGGNAANATGGRFANNAAGMLMDGTGNNGQGLIYVTDGNFANGGLKIIPGSLGNGSIYVDHAIEEGDFVHDMPPVVWITAGGLVTGNINSVNLADAGPSGAPAFRNDNTTSGIIVTDSESSSVPVGAAVILSQSQVPAAASTVNPISQYQVGFFNNYVVGETDVARRIGGLTPTRFLNKGIFTSPLGSPAPWAVTSFGSTSTLATGVADPFGGTLAATATASNGTTQNLTFNSGNLPGGCTFYSPVAGDWIVVGAWVKYPLGIGPAGSAAIVFSTCGGATPTYSASYFNNAMNAGGQWSFVWQANKVASGAGIGLNATVNFTNTSPVTVYGPTLHIIPAGTLSDSEVLSYAASMNSVDSSCLVGSICNITSHPVNADIFTVRSGVAPTGSSGITQLYMDSTANWLSFKSNNNTPYIVPGFTGSWTVGQCATATSTVNVFNLGTCGSGSGTIVASSQFSVGYYSASGTGTTITGAPAPTGPNGVFNFWGTIPSGGSGTVPTTAPAGIPGRTDSGATPTLGILDRANRVTFSGGGAQAVSVSDPTASGFGQNYITQLKAIGSGTVPTVTPTSVTINGASTLVMHRGEVCGLGSADNATFYANCYDPPITTCTGCTLTYGDYGLTLTVTAAAGDMIKNSTNTMGASGTLDGSAMATTAGFKVPVGAGAVPTADGAMANNSTNHTLVWGSNGTTMVGAIAATGTGTATTCTNQFVSSVSSLAIPTCNTVTPAYAAGNTTGSGNFVLVTSPTLVTPVLGAATATSLLATGIVDGLSPITVTTGASATLGGTYHSGYTFNQNATAATAIAYTLPTAAAGLQYCVSNSFNGTSANTGTLQLLTSAAGQFIIFIDGTLSASGGYVISGGAAADAACAVGVDSTHWMLYVQRGNWTKH